MNHKFSMKTKCKLLCGSVVDGDVSYSEPDNGFVFEHDGGIFTFPYRQADKHLISWCGQTAQLRALLLIGQDNASRVTNVVEKLCTSCDKMNDVGVNSCWWCGNKP